MWPRRERQASSEARDRLSRNLSRGAPARKLSSSRCGRGSAPAEGLIVLRDLSIPTRWRAAQRKCCASARPATLVAASPVGIRHLRSKGSALHVVFRFDGGQKQKG